MQGQLERKTRMITAKTYSLYGLIVPVIGLGSYFSLVASGNSTLGMIVHLTYLSFIFPFGSIVYKQINKRVSRLVHERIPSDIGYASDMDLVTEIASRSGSGCMVVRIKDHNKANIVIVADDESKEDEIAAAVMHWYAERAVLKNAKGGSTK